ncbi:MAG TPA: hypothetical protein VGW38_29405 [Chloroflexota bacterium]|nr:hypothetical protein [Chloroflexota bacterium]
MIRNIPGIAAPCIAALFVATPAAASCHGDWDVNADSRYDQAEFSGGIGENQWFRNRDADRDGFLSETEFGTGFYESFDRNRDGRLVADEWGRGFGETENYAGWDTDGDAALSRAEFDAGFGESGMYDEWDKDRNGMLSEDEYRGGIYTTYDADRSGSLEEAETGVACDDYGEEGFWDF